MLIESLNKEKKVWETTKGEFETQSKEVFDLKMEIERLNTQDIYISGVPTKVYKKLDKANNNINSKIKIVEENFRKEVTKMHEAYLAKELRWQEEI